MQSVVGCTKHYTSVVQSSMASSRKVRNANKRYAKINEDWQDKDETNVHKSKVRKKKLSDMLGSQWSKDELERFYGAYRKYGKDWRKVAGAIRDRTSEMVEALYNMNKAYLSLPEGTATVAGLIAMMTDHYNILEGSNSDRESNESPKASRKPRKHGRAGFQSVSKTSDTCYPDLLQSQPASSSYGCLSLLKKKCSGDLLIGNRPHAVGKRTPRVPIASMYYRHDRGVADRQAKTDADNGDDEGAHVAALALAEVCQRGGSPKVSETPGRSGDHMFLSPVKRSDRKNADSDMGSSKLHGFHLDADYPEGSIGSREAETGDYIKGASFFLKNEGSASGKPQKKVKRSQKSRKKAAHKTGDPLEDDREACSGTEEGHRARKTKEDSEMEALGWPSSTSNKRSRQLFFGDESSALDALHTLADLSVNILQPSTIVESESSAQIKDENKDDNSDEKPGMPAVVSVYEHKANSKSTARKVKRQSEIPNTEVVTRKKAKLAKDPHHDGSTSDVKQQGCTCGVKTEKKKRKSTSKVSKDEKNILKDVEKIEVSAEEGKVSSNKAMDIAETTTQGEATPQADLSSKGKSRRKLGIQQALTEECKPTKGADDTGSDKFSFDAVDLKDKLSHCLSSRLLRRWCMFEWFYGAIDYPWFAKSEFVEYLNHVKLGHVPRLTRVEWSVIRSSLGKPRRLSKQFLHEEREKLSQYRDSVRQHYAELQSGVREGLPTDLARPLAVGQRVIACHPKTRELHDGDVLTVDNNRCRVQFDRPELDVEFVMDIDCMPLHPMENFPESLRQQNIVNKYLSEVKLEDQMKELGSGSAARFRSNVNVNGADAAFHIPSGHPINTLMKQAKGDTIDSIVRAKATVNEVAVAAQQAMYNQPCSLSQIQEREADIRALAELSRALDKKEALLVELRHMNEEVSGKQKDGETIRDLKHFRTQYAMVLVQLRDSNDQVASALLSLRQRNTYHGNQVQSCPTSMENGGAFTRAPDPYNGFGYINPESGSQVIEVIETSRHRAKLMVDVAVQTMCKLSEGENAFAKIGEALDNLNSRGTGSGSSILGIRRIPPDSRQADTSYQDIGTPAPADHTSDPRLCNGCDSEAQFPTELISSCVATILMIQNCTEKQYHPAEVALILDSALSRLQPCSSQNIPIFREIEVCMGIIKNQMLALIPTPSG